MGDSKKLATSDDEDIEALRLAALRTIKKKNSSLNDPLPTHHMPQRSPEKLNHYNRSGKGPQNKRGRFFGPYQGRNGKNGQFHNRNRNPNLISIPTMASEEEKVQQNVTPDAGIVINLPQHRYCDGTTQEPSKEEGTSKFNRYNKSDESESESEEEEESASEDDSPGKLHKADSLEMLMQELDDEIQGKSKAKESSPTKTEKLKVKKMKKKKRTVSERVSTSDSDAKPADHPVEKTESDTNVEVIRHSENAECEEKQLKVEERSSEENKPAFADKFSPARKRPRSRSPANRRGFPNRRRPTRNFHKFQTSPLQNIPFLPPMTTYVPPLFHNPPFNPVFAPPILTQAPPFFERPLSPLSINAESLTTATLAPLSPRSAAFVLENKAIIERRKRSPRRSYSRSRSPSRSPRRSLTPRRTIRRSVSPRRISRSPRRRSLSPRRRSLSPRRKNGGRTAENSPKNRAPIRERLGVKGKGEEAKEKPKETQSTPKKDEKQLDPVLEARKRKFESNEIKIREGIIRLKPKGEKQEEIFVALETISAQPQVATAKLIDVEEKSSEAKKEELDVIEELENLLKDDTILEGDDIELNPKVADIFSDEDSASDNEGRFKIKEGGNAKPPVLSFTKLTNGEKNKIKAELLPDSKRMERRRDRRDRLGNSRTRGRSPVQRKEIAKSSPKKLESQDKLHGKSRVSVKNDRRVAPMERRLERKIEIKIKNPSKYERSGGKFKFDEDEKPREEAKRRVEVDKVPTEQEEDEPEIIVENHSGDDDDNSAVSEGDLRAQLSKKRAEKLHRTPIGGVSSRLLQNALQGAVFKKTKRKSKEQEITNSEFAAIKRTVHADYLSRRFRLAVKTQRVVRVYKHKHFKFRYGSAARTDGKLPIHLRLGIATASDVFADAATTTKPKRKSRKRKNREVPEQVYYLLLRHYFTSWFSWLM